MVRRLGLGLGVSAEALTRGSAVPPVDPAPLDGLSPSAAFSIGRQLLSTYTGDWYDHTEDFARVITLLDQSGNGRNLTQATDALRPSLSAAFGAQGMDFFSGGNQLVGPHLSQFISANEGMMVVSFTTRSLPRTDAAGCGIIADAAEGGNLSLISIGSQANAYAYQFDGAYKYTPKLPIYVGSPYVLTFRKDATKLYCRLNLGAEVEVAAGALTALGYNLLMSGTGVRRHHGMIFEFATWSTVPDAPTRDAIITAFLQNIGGPFLPKNTAGYPDATNTGTTGALTPSAGMTITVPGVYSDLDITGAVLINVNGVRLTNCRITTSAIVAVHVQAGLWATIDHCEINGTGAGNTTGILGAGTFAYNNIYGCENGISVSGSMTFVTNNYIHDLAAAVDPHYDCVECNGGMSSIQIKQNTLSCPSQTAVLNINNAFGAISDVLVEDNILKGGAYTVYVDGHFGGSAITNVTIRNNALSRGAQDFFNFNTATPTVTGNKELETGIPLV